MGRNDIIEKVEKVIAKEKVMEKPASNSNTWRKVNPAYEAIARAFVKYIDDEIIGMRIYNSGEIDEMGELVGIQSLMRRLSKNRRDQIEKALKDNKPIEEIIDFTALQIAEDKRAQNGSVLYQTSSQKNPKLFMRALRKADPYQVYIEGGEISRIEERAKKIEKLDKIKYAAVVALTGILLLTGVYTIRAWKSVNKKIASKKLEISRIEESIKYNRTYLSSLESQINSTIEKSQNTQSTQNSFQTNQSQLSNLEILLGNKKKELLDLDEKISARKKEYSDLGEKIEENKLLYDKKAKKLTELYQESAKRETEMITR